MGRYLTPSPVQSGPVKHQQVFKTSGTFTPSQALLDAGGVVEVRCVGGGGGGGPYAGGSSGMDITRLVTVSSPVTVTIGAGGYPGGATSFGTLLTALGGKSTTSYVGGMSAGEGSQVGGDAFMTNSALQKGRGGGSGGGVSEYPPNGLPNTGGGGGSSSYGGNGGSGLCIVTWEE